MVTTIPSKTEAICGSCGTAAWGTLHAEVRDYEHHAGAPATFVRCTRCGMLAQSPLPTAEMLRAAYPADYRPHVVDGDAKGLPQLVAKLKGVQAELLLRKLRRHLGAPDEPILELGCGAGHFLRRLQKRGFRNLHGVDREPSVGPALARQGIHFTALDIEAGLPLTERYHTILLNYVIEHLKDPEQRIRECVRLLKPGGQLLLLTPNASSLSHRWFGKFWAGLHAPRHLYIFTPDSVRALGEALGAPGVSIDFPTDPASWAISAQNYVESHTVATGAAPRYGTRIYTLALLPFCYPFAWFEKIIGRGASMIVRLPAPDRSLPR